MTTYDETQAFTANHDPAQAPGAVAALLAEPFGTWHVRSTEVELQLRVTKRGAALLHTAHQPEPAATADPAHDRAHDRVHDRAKARLLPEDDPVLAVLGIADDRGRIKPSRQAKYRQVEEFLRALQTGIDDARATGSLREPTADRPWVLVDLGCGNAYLTFAASGYLARRGLPARVVGVDAKKQSREHNSSVAEQLGIDERAVFVQGRIDEVDLVELAPSEGPDIVLALHACDTATDDALAAAVRAEAPLVLAAPCCHHELSAQLRRTQPPAPYRVLVRDGILRERFADTLTDALRAAALRRAGYRVEVVEFVESRHTPRNTLLRGVRTGSPSSGDELDALTTAWGVRPRLLELLSPATSR